jgi:hypothetical protein
MPRPTFKQEVFSRIPYQLIRPQVGVRHALDFGWLLSLGGSLSVQGIMDHGRQGTIFSEVGGELRTEGAKVRGC